VEGKHSDISGEALPGGSGGLMKTAKMREEAKDAYQIYISEAVRGRKVEVLKLWLSVEREEGAGSEKNKTGVR